MVYLGCLCTHFNLANSALTVLSAYLSFPFVYEHTLHYTLQLIHSLSEKHERHIDMILCQKKTIPKEHIIV